MTDTSKDYYRIYLKRLNRYGNNYQARTQNKREREFEDYLMKSVYRVDIEYDDQEIPAIFERYKQDTSEALHYLLTRVSTNIPNGTILWIPNKDNELRPWMVYYLEEILVSGYNRYVALKMTHFLTWIDRSKEERESWAYMRGRGDSTIRDMVQSKGINARYTEDTNLNLFIMPTTEFIRKDDYLEIGTGALKEAYRVSGYDIQSTPGVEYVSVDPVYLYDKSEAPEQTEDDSSDDFFWLKGE